MTNAETVPSWFLLNLKVVQHTIGIVEDESYERDDIKLINHTLLTFKHSLYNRRDASTPPNLFYVRERLKLVQKIEYKIAKDKNTLGLHFKKWEKIIPKS